MADPTNPLAWNVPITDAEGLPTREFMVKWQQQTRINNTIPPVIDTPEQVSAVLDLLGTTRGSVLVRGTAGWVILPPGTSGKVLTAHGAGADPTYEDIPAPPPPDIQALLDAISTTRGAVLFRGDAGWQALAPGTSGQFLQTQGAGADPQWAAAGGGGGAATLWGASGLGLATLSSATATATGSFTGNPQQSMGWSSVDNFYWNASAGAQEVKFNFGTPVTITGFGFMQSATDSQGTWQAAGSPDNAVWTNLGSPGAWGGAFMSSFNVGNTTPYQYYRLQKATGSTSSASYQRLFLFRWVL